MWMPHGDGLALRQSPSPHLTSPHIQYTFDYVSHHFYLFLLLLLLLDTSKSSTDIGSSSSFLSPPLPTKVPSSRQQQVENKIEFRLVIRSIFERASRWAFRLLRKEHKRTTRQSFFLGSKLLAPRPTDRPTGPDRTGPVVLDHPLKSIFWCKTWRPLITGVCVYCIPLPA